MKMNNPFKGLFIALTLFAAVSQARESIEIQFAISHDTAFPDIGIAEPKVVEAQRAFEALYGNEPGVLHTTMGKNRSLLVYMRSQSQLDQLFHAMWYAGTVKYHGNRAFFYYDTEATPSENWQYLGKVALYEGQYTSLYFPGKTEFIKQIQLRYADGCTVRAGVHTNESVRPTREIKTVKYGGYSVASTYAVNGGYGANIYGIEVITTQDSWIITDHCPIEVYWKN